MNRERAVGGPWLTLRLLGAVTAIAVYLLAREGLEPKALVAARFGLGLALLALFVDLGRVLVGASQPITGTFRPHRQLADPLVDDAYRDVHAAVRTYLDDGRWTPRYERVVDEAMVARGMTRPERSRALDELRGRATLSPPDARPLPLALLSGAVLVVGLAIGIGVLLEDQGVALGAPMLVFVGLGIATLQVRARHGRQAYVGLALGLVGSALVLVGARALTSAYGGGWSWLTWAALLIAGGSVALAFLHRPTSPSWRELRARLNDELIALRRAFVATVIAGLVLFPFAPLLEAMFTALGWPFTTPYRMAVVAYLTLAAFLALELVGAWYALGQGDRRERDRRAERVRASGALLTELERPVATRPGAVP